MNLKNLHRQLIDIKWRIVLNSKCDHVAKVLEDVNVKFRQKILKES